MRKPYGRKETGKPEETSAHQTPAVPHGNHHALTELPKNSTEKRKKGHTMHSIEKKLTNRTVKKKREEPKRSPSKKNIQSRKKQPPRSHAKKKSGGEKEKRL